MKTYFAEFNSPVRPTRTKRLNQSMRRPKSPSARRTLLKRSVIVPLPRVRVRSSSHEGSEYRSVPRDFASLFASIVEATGLNCHQLSNKTGIANSTFYKWLHGRCRPSYQTMCHLADCLGLSLAYFYAPEE